MFEAGGPGDGKDDKFDADVAIMTGEFGKLIPDLIEALDGEYPIDAFDEHKEGETP